MAKASKHPPQLYNYLRKYQEDPSSRVFAPLAEAYRKAGLIDEAIGIAREGLRVHPNFIGGKVALARSLFDKNLYEEVVSELKNVVQDAPDNLVAQRLMADSSLMLGDVANALNAFKMLLYFAPGNDEVAKMVHELEARAYEDGALVLRSDFGEAGSSRDGFDIRDVGSAIEGDPEVRRGRWIYQIQVLQGWLQNVERYRKRVAEHDSRVDTNTRPG